MSTSLRLRRDLAVTWLTGLASGFGMAVAFVRWGVLGGLLATLGPAQQYLNLTVHSAASATVIDWNGRPALCIINTQGGRLAEFMYTPVGPRVELAVQGLGVWDFRPCAVGSRFDLIMDDTAYRPWEIPPSGLFISTKPSYVMKWQGYQYSRWEVTYCPSSGPCGTCHPMDYAPEGVCLVAYLSVK